MKYCYFWKVHHGGRGKWPLWGGLAVQQLNNNYINWFSLYQKQEKVYDFTYSIHGLDSKSNFSYCSWPASISFCYLRCQLCQYCTMCKNVIKLSCLVSWAAGNEFHNQLTRK